MLTAGENIAISIVIPTYNSEEYIEITTARIVNFMKTTGIRFEVIIVDDGSNDKTLEKCLNLKSLYNNQITVIQLQKNQSQKTATLTGYSYAAGRYVVTFDDDLQHDVHDIVKLFDEIRKTELWVIGGYYDYSKPAPGYNIAKSIIYFMFNNVFFRPYKGTKYFTSFKIFDKHLLASNHIVNIFHFWEIPPDKIKPIQVIKTHKITGASNVNFIHLDNLFRHVFTKAAQKFILYFLLPLLLFFFLLNRLSIIFIIVTLLILGLVVWLLRHDKNYFKEIEKKIYR